MKKRSLSLLISLAAAILVFLVASVQALDVTVRATDYDHTGTSTFTDAFAGHSGWAQDANDGGNWEVGDFGTGLFVSPKS